MPSVLFNLYPDGRQKALTMSYDDGQLHDRRLVEIFNRHGIRGSFHLNSSLLHSPKHVSAEELPTLFAGHEVSVHSVTHPSLIALPREKVIDEILEDRRTLERIVGYPVRGMSYPFGHYNSFVCDILRDLGIEYARTTQTRTDFGVPDDFLLWHATGHHSHDIAAKGRQFKAATSWGTMMLMYVWGHRYEFAQAGNWRLIEEFCELMGGDDSIWYATNIEIVDYVKAVRQLRCSVGGTMIQNPSAIPVWVSIDGQPRRIAPGEILRIAG